MIRIIFIGKSKESWLKEQIDEYLKRLNAFTKVELIELKDEKILGKDYDKIKDEEGKKILDHISDDFLIALDENGKDFASETFAKTLKQTSENNLKIIIIILFLFSSLYWITALHKPFHVDEFYSWVYAERCTFGEIIKLKDFGIGHPPLYHILQKFVQISVPGYHHLYVRLVNYFIGSIFIILFIRILLKYKCALLYISGACISATTLEIFIFSRMWGLVCLASLLLFFTGELYCNTSNKKYLVGFFGAIILGFLSDYIFILLTPYILIIIFKNKPLLKRVSILSFPALLWFLAIYKSFFKSNEQTISFYLYNLSINTGRILVKLANIIFNFWFIELFLLVLLVVFILILLKIKDDLKAGNIKISSVSFFRIFDTTNVKGRLLVTVICALLIILATNQIFWRPLINKKYLFILCPYMFLLLFFIFDKRTLHVISVFLIISGLIYTSSNRIVEWYPPDTFESKVPVIFENEFSYATQYLKIDKNKSASPLIRDFSNMDMYCKLCRIGTDEIPFEEFNSFIYVSIEKKDNPVFTGFVLKSKSDIKYTWLDKLEFKYLTPIPKTKFKIFEYQRSLE
jgi:hypothetical protein